MDVREKLALSVCNATQKTNFKCEFNCEKKGKCAYCLVMADQMIANGVTVQEWISIKDRLPDRDGWYITQTNATGRSNGTLPQEFEIRNGVGRWRYRDRISPWNTTHWQPMPQPPKGE